MDSETIANFEAEYRDFEAEFLRPDVFWRAPVYDLEQCALLEIFDGCVGLFPDHPNEFNTVFYLSESDMPTQKIQTVTLTCDYFEHGCVEDYRNPLTFLTKTAERISGIPEAAEIDLPDLHYRELIILTLGQPTAIVLNEIKAAATNDDVA